MLAYSGTGVSTVSTVKIERPIKTLIITKDGDFTTETIDAKIQRKNGNIDIIPEDQLIVDIAEVSQYAEGSQFQAGTNATDLRVKFIHLSETGSIPLGNGDMIVLNIKGLTGARTYEVYGLETVGRAISCLKYEKATISESQSTSGSYTRSINANNKYLAIKPTNLTELNLTTSTGEDPELTLNELKYKAFMENDVITMTPTGVVKAGYENVFFINAAGLASVRIKTNGSALDYYVISQQSL